TTPPSTTLTAVTVPPCGATTGISIFMDSRMTIVSPSATSAPGATSTFHTLATISASTLAMARGTLPHQCLDQILLEVSEIAEDLVRDRVRRVGVDVAIVGLLGDVEPRPEGEPRVVEHGEPILRLIGRQANAPPAPLDGSAGE